MKYARLLIPILVFVFGCGASQKTVKMQPDQAKKTSSYDESFDPLSLKDDDIVIKPNSGKQQKDKSTSAKPVEKKEDGQIQTEVDGYRVQLLATRSIESATLIKQKAEEQFAPYDYKVYWSFEAPFYKIRIGDVLKRTEAETIRDLAKTMGYDQAFPVRSKVHPQSGGM